MPIQKKQKMDVQDLETMEYAVRSFSKNYGIVIKTILLIFREKILQVPALTLCNSANGGKALIFRRFRHLPFGRVIRISRRIPA